MKKRTVAVLGLSVFGRETALGLSAYRSIDVVAMDYRKEEVDAVAPSVRRAVVADVRQPEVLEQEGAASWSAAVVGIRRHFDSTVLVTHFLKTKMKTRTVIAQVNSEREDEAIRAIGADLTVFPDRDSAHHLVAKFAHPLLTEIVNLGEGIELVEVEVPHHFVGRTLKQLQLRTEHRIHVVATRPGFRKHGAATGAVEVPPDPDRLLGEEERMMLIGAPDALLSFLDSLPER